MDRISTVSKWVRDAQHRIGTLYASDEKCMEMAESYLPRLTDIPDNQLLSILERAERHYGLESKIPSAGQIHGFWWSLGEIANDHNTEPAYHGSKYTQKQEELVFKASRWQTNGQSLEQLNDEIMMGIGLIIGDMPEQSIPSTIAHWEKLTGKKIQLYEAG